MSLTIFRVCFARIWALRGRTKNIFARRYKVFVEPDINQREIAIFVHRLNYMQEKNRIEKYGYMQTPSFAHKSWFKNYQWIYEC